VALSAEGDGARLTDERLDPGTLCRDRTVTGRYEVNIARDVPGGQLSVLIEAYDANQRLLERDTATIAVVNPLAPTQTPPPEPTEPAGAAGGGAQTDPPADQAATGDEESGLPLVWFLVGGLMVFLGLSLLLNVRRRRRDDDYFDDPTPVTAPLPPPGPFPPRGPRTRLSPAAARERLANYRTIPRRPRDRGDW
jgi:hypothetical protein